MTQNMFQEYKMKVIEFYREERRMPNYTEIMKLFGFKSKNAVFKLVNKLIEDGVVTKGPTGKLAPARAFNEVPFLGLVEAGFPTMIDEEMTDTLNIDQYLIKHKDSTYILEVKGDSMIEEGIKEGDLVIAERRGSPQDGDIVIAEIDGGWTMKYFKKNGEQIYLLPANKKYSAIYPEYDLKIAAIVKGVIRKY